MRLYTFTNMYLSGIQHGIQSLHVLGDMWSKYRSDTIPEQIISEWAMDHKTVIVLNGGSSFDLVKIHERFQSYNIRYPYAHFREEGLGDALTAVGIILPRKIYNWKELRIENKYGFGSSKIEGEDVFTYINQDPKRFSDVNIIHQSERLNLLDFELADFIRKFRKAI